MGPFSEELNTALLKQYDISVLVTKDSGKAGGFAEKISACKKLGTLVYCIRRPEEDEGISTAEALREILKLEGYEYSDNCLTVNIIGIGMGDRNTLTLEANEAIERSEAVFGASRLINDINCNVKYPYYLWEDVKGVLKVLLFGDGGKGVSKEVAVLFSGDIGFFSGAGKFEKEIRKWADEEKSDLTLKINKYPGISCVSYFSSRLGKSYQDAGIISLHGKNSPQDIAFALDKIRQSKNNYVLVSDADDIRRLWDGMKESGITAKMTVGSNLSYEGETVKELLPGDICEYTGKGLYTLFVENLSPQKQTLIPFMEDDEFIRNKTPMTKALIRHECIRQLRLREGDVFFDVGSGTGSVAIEAAGLSGSIKVFSFEKKSDAIEVQKENIEKFKCGNITLIEGEAPESFKEVSEVPDAVFIGGSAGKLEDILDVLRSHDKSMRIVITAITMETMNEILRLKEAADVKELEIQQITGSRAEKAGDYNLMKTDNSVMIASFLLSGGDDKEEEDR